MVLCVSIALVAFGGNIAPQGSAPHETIMSAIASLERHGLEVLLCSRLFRTPCFPPGAGPDYVNAAATLQIPPGMTAPQVLDILHTVEAEFGRERTLRWGARTLDIDLLALDDQVLPDAATQTRWRQLPLEAQKRETPTELILPHPRLAERAFVLVPLAEVAPDWHHPLTDESVRSMLAALPASERAEVVAMPARGKDE